MAAMQRNRRDSDSPARPPPHFSAFVLEFPIPQHRLMIPKKSAMRFGKELSESAFLVVPDGRSWKVELKRDGEKIWFCDGLQGFLNYYSVQYFFTLLFRYEGNSVFCVCICDELGAEIDYPSVGPSRDREPKLDIVQVVDTKPSIVDGLFCKIEDEGFEILGMEPHIPRAGSKRKDSDGGLENQHLQKSGNFVLQRKMGRYTKRIKRATSVAYQTRSRSRENEEEGTEVKEPGDSNNCRLGKPKCNSKSSPSNVGVKHEEDVEMIVPKYVAHVASARPLMSNETEKAIRAANSCKLQNPSFMAILTPYYIKQGWVTVPVDFVRRHLDFSFEDIQLQACNGRKKWPARCYSVYKRGSLLVKRIGKGWVPFSAKEKLKEGDVCVFELIKKGNKEATLRVWIYRAADYAKLKSKRFGAK